MEEKGARARQTGRRDSIIVIAVLAVAVISFFLIYEQPQRPQPPGQAGSPAQSASPMIAGLLDGLPEDYMTLVGMGNQYMDERNYAVAAEIYRRALAIDGSAPDVRTDYGACLHGMGLPERAIDEFSRVVSEHPEHPVALFNLGIVYYGLDRTDSARYYWESFLQVEPNGQIADAARQYLAQLGG